MLGRGASGEHMQLGSSHSEPMEVRGIPAVTGSRLSLSVGYAYFPDNSVRLAYVRKEQLGDAAVHRRGILLLPGIPVSLVYHPSVV